MHIWADIIAAVAIFGMFLLTRYVIEPWIKLRNLRRQSSNHFPQVSELWVQDGEMLYIVGVSNQGVEIISWDPTTRQPSRWNDTWDDWRTRLKTRVVYFSGQRQELKL